MIRLFRHDGLEIMLRVDMIREIDPGPPTVITLLDGETLQVKNTSVDVMTKIRSCRQGIESENQEYDPVEKGRPRPRLARRASQAAARDSCAVDAVPDPDQRS